ncbi:MAG: haloacid dehalogenase [Sphingomonas bacterium]|uniref:HAD family hydrolase n=1 Tax=Sphingomonas bacterium TaxID=1895847 RepID=UPI00261EF322|nr:HAD family phosphatase [Sphingomonas bacterium]MDB5710834.1 haloacid dehalogenase [Sphingomonas bacterium]
MRFDGLIFDFDGVLLESEYAGNRQIAEYLTSRGHPTTPEESMAQFMGLAGHDFLAAIERWIGRAIPDDFHAEREVENQRALSEGLDAVAGAVAFVRSLPPSLPRAIASSSSTAWIERHLDHLGIRDAFGDKIFSGREHVERGKPAPDLYLHAAQAIGIDIARAAIIEDSPVGATGAVASGAYVIGFVGGSHCGPDHAERLRTIGVHDIAATFDEVAALLE